VQTLFLAPLTRSFSAAHELSLTFVLLCFTLEASSFQATKEGQPSPHQMDVDMDVDVDVARAVVSWCWHFLGSSKKQNFIEKKVQPASRCTTKVSRRTFEPSNLKVSTCRLATTSNPRVASLKRVYFGLLPGESITKRSVSGKK